MTSSGRELLKWIAVALMTLDHALKVFQLGYVPVATELGRVAFPIFALVMAYNLAQPGADVTRSIRRLALWAIIAQPAHAFAFGHWLPVNILWTFVVAACAIWALGRRNWHLAAALLAVAPIFLDYAWAGVWLVVGAWACFRENRVSLAYRPAAWALLAVPMVLLCAHNGNGWALLALPALALGRMRWRVGRTRWAFYGYYVGHLAAFGLLALLVHPTS